MDDAIKQFIISPLIYKLLCLIETLQMMYFIIHPQLGFTFSIMYFQYVQLIDQYLQINYILQQIQEQQILIIMYVLFTMQIFVIILLCISMIYIRKRTKVHKIVVYSLKIIGLFSILSQQIFCIFYINTYIVVIICQKDSSYNKGANCYSGTQLFHTIMSIIGLVSYIMLHLIISTFYYEMNPFSKLSFAQSYNKQKQFSLFAKIVIITFVTIDYNGTSGEIYITLLTIIYFIQIYLRIVNPPHFDRNIHYFLLGCDSFLFILSITVALHKFLDLGSSDNIGFYFILLAILFNYYIVCQIYFIKIKSLLKLNIRQIQDATRYEQYFIEIIQLIENKDTVQSTLALAGVLVSHMEYCNQDNCNCKNLIDKQLQNDKEWYTLLITMIDKAITKFSKSANLYLLSSFIYSEKLNNKFRSYQQLLQVKKLDATIREKYSTFKQINYLEQKMQEEDIKNEQQIDMVQIVKFQKYYSQFQTTLKDCSEYHMQFWEELQEFNPDLPKIYQLGALITKSVEDVNQIYQKLIQNNPNSIITSKIYGHFMNDVLNNETIGNRILEKADQLGKSQNLLDVKSLLTINGISEDTCIIICKSDPQHLGIISTCNQQVQMFGYEKQDLINNSINILMPQCITDQHDKMLLRYLQTNESKFVGQQRTVYTRHKSGYIMPSNLIFKVLPRLNKGLSMIGFLKCIQSTESYILFDPGSFQILGIDENCINQYGIDANLCMGNIKQTNQFTLHNIIKNTQLIIEKLNQKDQFHLPFKLTIDTTQFKERFHLDQSYERSQDSIHDYEIDADAYQKKKTHYKVQDIRCNLQRIMLDEEEIILLKFTEYWEQQSFKTNQLNDIVKTTKNNIHSLKKIQAKKSKATIFKDGQLMNEDIMESVHSSVEDVGGKEISKMKELKQILQSKETPLIIKIIRISMLVMTILVFLTQTIDVFIKNNINDSYKQQATWLSNAHNRNQQMSTSFQYAVLLDMLARGQYKNTENKTRFVSQLQKRIVTVIQNSDLLMRLRIQFDLSGLYSPPFRNVTLTKLLLTNQTDIVSKQIEESMTWLYSHMVFESTSNFSEFTNPNQITFVQQSMFYIKQNGYLTIRQGLEDQVEEYLNDFISQTEYNLYNFLYIMIGALISIILSYSLILPKIFLTDQINNKVLSMFGLIPMNENKILSTKCHLFLENFIEDFKKDEIGLKIQKSPRENQYEINNEVHVEQTKNTQLKSFQQEEQINQNSLLLSPQHNQITTRKKNKKTITIIELSELEKERVQKFEMSNIQYSRTIPKVIIFFILFCGYFITEYILMYQYTKDILFLFDHMDLCSKRYATVSYSVILGMANLARVDRIMFNGYDLQYKYLDSIYQNERQVLQSFQDVNYYFLIIFYLQWTISGFNTYRAYFRYFTFQDQCLYFSLLKSHETTLSQSDCMATKNGILRKGLQTSVIDMALYLNTSFKVSDTSSADDLINGDIMQTVIKFTSYLRPAFSTLNYVYLDDSILFINNAQNIEIGKYIGCLCGWICLLILIWIPYLAKLSKQLWQTKGMLNLIPMYILLNNKKIKQEFIRQKIMDILQ